MKKIFKYSLIVIGGLLLSNCNDTDDIEVVKFDDSFIPAKPVEKDRDTPPKVNLLDNIIFFANSENTVQVNKETLDTENFINIPVSTNRKVTEDLAFHLNLDENWVSNNPNLTILPETAYKIEKQTLTQGKRNGSIKVVLNTEEAKKLDRSYYLPLQIISDNENLNVLKGFDKSVFKIIIKKSYPIPNENNVSVIEDLNIPFELGDKINFNVNANYATGHTYKINDGRNRESWWVDTRYNNIFLEMKFETRTVKAMFLTLNSRDLEGLKVSVSNDNGETWIDQGEITLKNTNSYAYIVFEKPIDINAIKFSNFKANGSNSVYANINEVDIYSNR
ncbi:DUF1735 domain-containing protein [Ornithobacterium rhinotracheale]|uniref:DUF1735 domain-containing protein n=1 Tax=Ornithobacterium rhinotracheale TaxID=28251 RepID=UPI004036E26E